MSFSVCESYDQLANRAEELRDQYVQRISAYADETYDGTECIAEAFVRQIR